MLDDLMNHKYVRANKTSEIDYDGQKIWQLVLWLGSNSERNLKANYQYMLDPDPDWTGDHIGTAVGAINTTTIVAPPK